VHYLPFSLRLSRGKRIQILREASGYARWFSALAKSCNRDRRSADDRVDGLLILDGGTSSRGGDLNLVGMGAEHLPATAAKAALSLVKEVSTKALNKRTAIPRPCDHARQHARERSALAFGALVWAPCIIFFSRDSPAATARLSVQSNVVPQLMKHQARSDEWRNVPRL